MSIIEDKKTKSPLTKAEIKKFQKLEKEAENNTDEKGDYMDDIDYCLGNFAEDLCDAGDKEWARRIYKIVEEKLDRAQIDRHYYLSLAEHIEEKLGDKEWSRDTYKKAIQNDGSNLQYADKSLKKDKKFILEAVKNNGSILQYAPLS